MASNVSLKAIGLNYSPNQLSLPDGSLVVAKDVIIRRDNVVESRRGFREYSESIISKQLIEYKNRILSHDGSELSFDTGEVDSDGKAIFDAFSGTYSETETGLRIKSIESNKNLYFTSSEGIKKISAQTASDFSTASNFITDAGALRALDVTATLEPTQGQLSGFLPNDSAVAYRVLFGYKDNNDNLILGYPSDRVTVYNYLVDVISMDLDALLLNLDAINQSPCLINDGDYSDQLSVGISPVAETLKTNVLSLATKLDTDIYLAGSGAPLTFNTFERSAGGTVKITFSAGDPTDYLSIGDSIELKGITTTFESFNGNHLLTNVQSTYIEFVYGTGAIAAAAATGAPKMYSYNYQYITHNGDDTYSEALNDLVISSPETSEEIRNIHHVLGRIIDRLKVELPDVIPSTLQAAYITPLILTDNANVKLKITLPTNFPSYYFVQVYRTRNFTADGVQTLGGSGGVPVDPDDEMRLVFEQFPTSAEISANEVIFEDSYPEDLILNNTNLYTNPVTGEGILQANSQPPLAKDINRFKNVVFYANTRTKHRLTSFQLLGVSQISNNDKIVITSSLGTDTYSFITGVAEITDVQCTTVVIGDAGTYFVIYTGGDNDKVVFWLSVDNTGSQPTVTGATRYVKIPLLSTMTAAQVADVVKNTIASQIYDFTAEVVATNKVRVTNVEYGKTTDASNGGSPFTISTNTQGNGEDAASKQVLLSSALSAAQAIDETARSLVRVINKQSDSPIYAYYISSENTPPGQMFFESKTLDDAPFYILGSNNNVGASFNPDISPTNTITANSLANPTVITSASHGLQNNDQIVIVNSNSTPSIDGLYTVTRINANTFSIPVNVTVAGTQGAFAKIANVTVSTDEQKANRIYYSKFQQPEAVPLLNYIDVGPEDKAILRIYPLRDSLFVFKEDGLYRISGESSPFVLSLFDSSCVLIAPDSVSPMNNVIYAWTNKGISNVTETGVNEISRPIDTEILRLSSAEFSNFKKVTWGVGYNSDNSYTVYTNTEVDDEVATIGFRFSDLTNTWTNIDRSQTCGIVLSSDDKLYMGGGDVDVIHQERKTFTRKDYADKDFGITLGGGSLFNNGRLLQLTNVSTMDVGDVLTQEQTLTVYKYNALLLHLDNDPTLDHDYFDTLEAETGDDMRAKLVALAAKLDSDIGGSVYSDIVASKSPIILSNDQGNPTVITTNSAHGLVDGRIITITGTQSPASDPVITGTYKITYVSSTKFSIPVDVNTGGGTGLTASTAPNLNDFRDIQACFNGIVNQLNVDTNVTLNNYQTITDTTLFEAVIVDINYATNQVTVNLPLQWVLGDMRVYKAIDCKMVYAPLTFGDPLMSKQVFETTMMFNSKAFTKMTAAYSSDLKPEFVEVDFYGQGNGIFGHYSDPGFGYGFFGGGSNAAPFRTIIPRQTQRCRYMNVGLGHRVARESWSLYGVTLTFNNTGSTRAYR